MGVFAEGHMKNMIQQWIRGFIVQYPKRNDVCLGWPAV